MTVQLRYEYAPHQRSVLRKAKDLGITPKRVHTAAVPPLRLRLYPIFTSCLVALGVVPVLYRRYGTDLVKDVLGGWAVYEADTLVAVLTVLGVAGASAAVQGDMRGWLEYNEM